jgi:hypothetical protein
MNQITIKKIKKIINNAESEKVQYFNFVPKVSSLSQFKDPIIIFHFESKEKKLKRETKLEKLKIIENKLNEEIKLIEKKLYEENSFSNNIYIKSKTLYFFNIEVSSNEDFLLIKDNDKNLYLNFNQGISIKIKEDEIIFLNNKLSESIYIYYSNNKENIDIDGVCICYDKQKTLTIFQKLIETIILNKNLY